MFIKQTVV